ncbi:hypothetical protein GFL93_32355 [Rhizobium leguminosarum bv. viciae]|uniref:Electron transfer flavoprotein alpha/beta-subunit N-terminal domain-containing protein n=1 Tax=Rhizobium leguminosarum bv. viciae TaxID=387 RepID=A0A8G2MLY5_RHILV|nr:hypothetical protein [Rhizobium leguminosarum]NKK10481.1 hypothetical protein [Rhizobium leguminosarum bv. viciae]NKK23635.1 hypothetical protein [Rhizobium leguminosarum bv. viciae]TBX85098.1 hypothetical protein E0H31_35585 [Rhizobium leguminosarum bv. viciae]TBY74067.1 hypothetical protein E0H32_31870 [Rhizobium leguminosarum bv. viciae]
MHIVVCIKQVPDIRGPDSVLIGKQTIDGDTAPVGPGIAKRLNLQQLSCVAKIVSIDPISRELVVERRAQRGASAIPASVSTTGILASDDNFE